MKKIAIGIGAFFGLLVVLLLLAPMLVSIDKFRPQIQDSINKNLRGKVELGELQFSAFPKIKIKINGLKATAPAPFNKSSLAVVKSAELQMPLTSLIFSPSATFVLVEPKIVMEKVGEKSSLSEFLPAPTPSETAQAPHKNSQTSEAVGQTLSGLPPFLASRIEKARFSFAIESGSVEIKDSAMKKGEKTQVKDLDLSLNDIGIRSSIGIDSAIDLDLVQGENSFLGKILLKGDVTYDPQGKINNIGFKLKTDLKGLELKTSALHKPKDVDLALSLEGKAVQAEFTDLMIEKLGFSFDKVNATASVNLQKMGAPDSQLDFKFNAPGVELAPFGAFVESIRTYSLKGSSDIKIGASGPLSNLNLDVLLVLKNVAGQTPGLKQAISDLDGQISVKGTSQAPLVNISNLKVKIASSDLGLNATVAGTATAPFIKASLTSKNLNLDELMGLQTLRLDNKTEEQKKQEAFEKEDELRRLEASKHGGAAMPSLDENLDKMAPELEKSLKNPLLDKAQASLTFNLAHVRAIGADYTAVTMTANYAKRKLSNTSFALKGYQGSLTANLGMELNPQAPAFNLSTKLSNVSIGNFLELHAPSWKGMMSGNTNGDFSISGQGLRKSQLDKNLNGSFKANITNGSMKMPVAAILAKVLNSIPAAQKKVEGKEDPKGTFKTCKLISSIKGRMLYLDDLDVVYDTEKMNLGDMRFQSKGTVAFDRNVDITGTAFLEPGKLPIPGLKGGSGKDEIPLRFKGDMIDPKPDYEYTAKILLPKIAKGALATQGGQKLQEEAKKKLGALLGGGASDGDKKDDKKEEIKKGINDLKKKFGF